VFLPRGLREAYRSSFLAGGIALRGPQARRR